MRRFFGLIVAVAIGTLFVTAISARAAGLTGNMTPFGYLLGASWNCSTNVPAMGNMPAHTDQGTATFDTAPNNTVRNHVSTPDYSGDYYFGYNDKMSMYWQTSADNMGAHAFLTSSDGKTYTGTSSMGPLSMQDTVTYARLADNKITVHEVLTGAGSSGAFDTVCTR